LGEIKKQSIQASVILIIGVLLGFILKLYVFPAYLKPSEIGLLTVLLDISNLIAAFVPLGGQPIFIKFLPKYIGHPDKASSLRRKTYLLTAVGFVLFFVFFFIFKENLIDFYQQKSPLLSKYFLVIVPLVIARVLYLITTAYSKGSKKTVFPFFTQEILVRLLTIIGIVLYGYSVLNLNGLVAVYLGIYFLSGFLVFASIKKMGGWEISKVATTLEKLETKEILTFGAFSILTNVGTFIIRSIDSIMLASIKDLEAAGIYSIAFFIGLFVEIPRRAISQISRPFLADAFNKNKLGNVKDIYQKSALNQLVAGSIIFVGINASLQDLFLIMPNGDVFSVATNVVLLIGLAKLIDMSAGGTAVILSNSPHYKYNFISILILAPLGIATNLVLIPKLGISGAAWASLITISLVNLFRFIVIYWKFKLLPFTVNWLKAFVLLVVSLFIANELPMFANPYFSIVLKSGLLGIFMISMVYFFNISPDLKDLINQKIGKKK